MDHPPDYALPRYRTFKAPRQGTDNQSCLFAGLEPSRDCPTGCGGQLLVRNGRFDQFLGCSNFPTCGYSCNG
ncbi:topoisomerase DNA-binding C4 zinc finger domain-containing protein [Sphingopyxis sp.]|uniref:topoisomerase DNA-binding C4 zinc finger domain-containing protein n=1 Tax=Sphingopyxis sp. TaxID=1908224 RepID=UPI0035B2DE00